MSLPEEDALQKLIKAYEVVIRTHRAVQDFAIESEESHERVFADERLKASLQGSLLERIQTRERNLEELNEVLDKTAEHVAGLERVVEIRKKRKRRESEQRQRQRMRTCDENKNKNEAGASSETPDPLA